MGPAAAEHAPRTRGRDRDRKPLGQRRDDRQGRLPPRARVPAVGAAAVHVSLRRRRPRRIHDRHGLCRARPHLRKRRAAGRSEALRPGLRLHGARPRPHGQRALPQHDVPARERGIRDGRVPPAAAGGAAHAARLADAVRPGRRCRPRRALRAHPRHAGRRAGQAHCPRARQDRRHRHLRRAGQQPCAARGRARDAAARPPGTGRAGRDDAVLRHDAPHALERRDPLRGAGRDISGDPDRTYRPQPLCRHWAGRSRARRDV